MVKRRPAKGRKQAKNKTIRAAKPQALPAERKLLTLSSRRTVTLPATAGKPGDVVVFSREASGRMTLEPLELAFQGEPTLEPEEAMRRVVEHADLMRRKYSHVTPGPKLTREEAWDRE